MIARYRPLLIAALLLPLAACVAPQPQPTRNPRPQPRPPVTQPAPPPSTTSKAPAPSNAPAARRGGRPQVRITEPDIKDGPPDPRDIPYDVAMTPDAVVRREPRSASGNPVEYEAFGEIYRILDSTDGFRQRGRASWYGKKFHGKSTASGEPYDMFAMTGAHKTLPIPSYVRVRNLENGKTAVVRINDRGPFHSERIIDLSYTAAVRLDMLGGGSVAVEIEALQPTESEPTLSATPAPAIGGNRWVQVAAYSSAANAETMRSQLLDSGLRDVDVRSSMGGALHRVVIGPFNSLDRAKEALSKLHEAGYPGFLRVE